MANQKNGGLKRLIKAFVYSFQGLKATFKNEAAFRQEFCLSLVLIPLGFWLGDTGTDRALLIGSLMLVMIVELINSGIEAVVDRVSGERHELSGRAKDVGSAAVLIALLNALAVWTLILFT